MHARLPCEEVTDDDLRDLAWEFLEVGVPHQAALKIWKIPPEAAESQANVSRPRSRQRSTSRGQGGHARGGGGALEGCRHVDDFCECTLESARILREEKWIEAREVEEAHMRWKDAVKLQNQLSKLHRERGEGDEFGPTSELLEDFHDLQEDLVMLQAWKFDMIQRIRNRPTARNSAALHNKMPQA